MEESYDVFISYSRKDTGIADLICRTFDKYGITYFIDRQEISGGMEFPEIIANAILQSKLFLYLASKNSYASKITKSEITIAFNKKPRNSIMLYSIDDTSLPDGLCLAFAAINRRNIKDHPIESTLVNDIYNLLARKDLHTPKGDQEFCD